jgi:hypothetical protein
MKHRVKVNYVVEVEAVSHAMAISKAMADLPLGTTNVTTECWTPKQKAQPEAVPPIEIPVPESLLDESEMCPSGCGHKVGQHDRKGDRPAGCLVRNEVDSGYCDCDWPAPLRQPPLIVVPEAPTPIVLAGPPDDDIQF